MKDTGPSPASGHSSTSRDRANREQSSSLPDGRRAMAPPAGWRAWTGEVGPGDVVSRTDYDLGDLMDTGAAVAVTPFRPGGDQAVLVVAAAISGRCRGSAPAATRRAVCRGQPVDQGRTRCHPCAAAAHWEEWNLYGLGPSNGEDGQTRMAAQLTRVLPENAGWASSLPPGILALDPWLRYAGPRPSDP